MLLSGDLVAHDGADTGTGNGDLLEPLIEDGSLDEEESVIGEGGTPTSGRRVSWCCQFRCLFGKNLKLLSRRPALLTCILLSGVISVVLAWTAGRGNPNAIYPELDACGGIADYRKVWPNATDDFDYDERVQLTRNEAWRNGWPLFLLTLGPLLHAICAYLMVHNEHTLELVGVLKTSLGVRTSAYWMSWYALFALSGLFNAVLAAVAAKMLAAHVHVFAHASVGVFVLAEWLLLLSTTSSAFFLVALCGSRKNVMSTVGMVVGMIVACCLPFLFVFISTIFIDSPRYGFEDEFGTSGTFWGNRQTRQFNEEYDYKYCKGTNCAIKDDLNTCTLPLISKDQEHLFKDPSEQTNFNEHDMFLGCYFNPSWPAIIYHEKSGSKKVATRFAFFVLNPYFHFTTMWGSILGYTSLPDNYFSIGELSHSIESLARKSLPGGSDVLYPHEFSIEWTMDQHSMAAIKYNSAIMSDDEIIARCPPDKLITHPVPYCDEGPDYFQRCPAKDWIDHLGQNYNFCEYEDCHQLKYREPTSSPSGLVVIGYDFLLVILYLAMAMYWSDVFPGVNGKARKWHYPFSRSFRWVRGDGGRNERATETPGVVIDCISKSYGSMQALREVSLSMERGVIALLGHNGAGKTTLTRIICCDVAPTSGDATVLGHSINDDPDTVRNSVGICQQDDYLWPNLSAKEHMDIYASLRGVLQEAHDETVQKWLSSVELSDEQLQYSSAFSGGMKRRLSVALSTIGKRPLILLDEPTTGMDPISRRSVWRHIEEIRKDCVVILTTHGMDEADLLADEVAIMKKGELVALGTPLQLKSQHGSALIFTLIVTRERAQEAVAMIQQRFDVYDEWVFIEAGNSGNITVRILKVRADNDCMGDGNSVGVNAKDLSDFVAWMEDDPSPVLEYGFSNSSLEEVFLKITGEGLEEDERADENDQQTLPSCCFLCHCCCSRPSEGHRDVPVDERGDAEAANSALGASEIASFHPRLDVLNQSRTIFFEFWKRTWLGRGSITSYVVYGILFGIVILAGLGQVDEYSSPSLFMWVTIFASLMLLSVIAPIYSDRAGGMFYLTRSQGALPSSYIIGTCMYSLCIQMIYTATVLLVLFALPVLRKPKDCPGENCYGQPYGHVPFVDSRPVSIPFEVDGVSANLSVSRSPGSIGMVVPIAILFSLSTPGAVLVSGFLPGYRLTIIVITMVTIASGFWPFFDFLLVNYNKCQKDIASRVVCGDRIFTGDGDALDFLDCVGYSTMDSVEFNCLSNNLNGLLPQFGLFRSLTSIFFANLRFHSDTSGFVESTLIPRLKGATCSGDTCHFPHAYSQFTSSLTHMFVGDMLLFAVGMAFVLVAIFPNRFLSAQKDRAIQWLQSNLMMSRHISQDEEANNMVSDSNELTEVREERERVTHILEPICEAGDTTVLRQPVESSVRDDLPPILTHKLKKIYPALGGRPPKIALKGLDMHVPKNEVLGFLGKNGAGKSTALKILSGAHESSGGLGLIGGYDSTTDRLKVFERLGYCAQFDIIWAGQSVRHHLEFFARLKGLPWDQVPAIAHSIAQAVGLGMPDVYNRLSGALSGGMRRRLSIAMSLIGSPSSLVLDEPTTGLDPSTRNSIWDLIGSFSNESRGIIITTHMLLEADTLCNRIAIIADGKLKVIGTQQYLKNQYGSGYSLQVNLTTSITDGGADRALSFVREQIHEGAQFHRAQAKTIHISLPRDTELQRVFAAMYSPQSASEGCINQFLLSQSSLEDVFVAFGEEQGDMT